MTLSLHLIRLVKDNQENIAKERLERMSKDGEKETVIHTLKILSPETIRRMSNEGEKETVIHTLKILSPETIRRNVSNDNFLKFQWPWTV